MITLTLPDGSQRQFSAAVTGAEVASSIGARLAKDALVIKVNNKLFDLDYPITTDGSIEIITRKHPDALAIIRHDCAHVMAEAVQSLFPDTQVTIGPAIDNGFYYDFHRAQPFTPEDLATIETRMRALIAKQTPIVREVWSREQAIAHFSNMGETFKVELIRDLPASETITIYRQGEWLDLCRGPHAPHTAHIGTAFKLTSVAGAYWRGDAAKPQLQRIYGTAWRDEKELQAYLTMLEEAEKRDHRKLGPALHLFHLQEEAAGMVFWHPHGWTLYRQLQNYIRARITQAGYVEVNTPQLLENKFWVASGHWENYRDKMFVIEEAQPDGEKKIMALKPMNCPCHVQIFNHGVKSYRDLPLRMAEFGSCMRNETSGSLHGLMRVRSMVQDDAHIFCTPEQIESETKAFCDLVFSAYRDFGFTDVRVRLADRPAQRAGSDAVWDLAEGALKNAASAAGLSYDINPGDGAFYGPKLEFYLKDTIGREWQCGTLQVDFVLPDRLQARYTGDDGQKHTCVMLHRAVFGSLERFIGILIENYAGKFPLWLAPLQVVIAPITNDLDAYATSVQAQCAAAGLRTTTDLRPEKINSKIRDHSHAKVPIMMIIGKREAETNQVTLRRLGEEAQQTLPLQEALALIKKEAQMPSGQPLTLSTGA